MPIGFARILKIVKPTYQGLVRRGTDGEVLRGIVSGKTLGYEELYRVSNHLIQ